MTADGEALVKKLRDQCIKRGTKGIDDFGRMFKVYDDDGSHNLDMAEFTKGIHDYGLSMSKDEIATLFKFFDKDSSKKIDYEEFLEGLRGPMNQHRIDIVNEAFIKLDKTKDGVITVDDLKGVYNFRNHPQYVNGELTEQQCMAAFISNFDTGVKDGKVTKEEFTDYYRAVSASIDSDVYFDLMIRKAWKLN